MPTKRTTVAKNKLTAFKELEHYRNEAMRYRALFNASFSTNRIAACAALKDDQRIYRKVGEKFLPVNDPYAYDGLRNGFWLVQVKDGGTHMRQQIYPDSSPQRAAAILAEEKIVEIIRKASAARPTSIPLTPTEKVDWDAFIKKHGDRFSTLQYPSFQENAEKIVASLLNDTQLTFGPV